MDSDVYCICRRKYDESLFMIECHGCREWFHGNCIGVTENEAEKIDEYYCNTCQNKHGPTRFKDSIQQESCKPDEFELIDHQGTKNFYEALDSSSFLDCNQVVSFVASGAFITPDFIFDHALEKPLVIEKIDGLGMFIPPIKSSKALENIIGSAHKVNVHDIFENEDRIVKLSDWTEHFDSDRTLENISVVSKIDIFHTKLLRLIKVPKIVKELDWIESVWPNDLSTDDFPFEKPKTAIYISFGDQASFLNFQIGMAGSSVWYYNMKGVRTFYLVPPSEENLKIFEEWSSRSSLEDQFYGDLADACYKLVVNEGEFLLIPGGWIFAEYVNKKSISVMGHFCHNFNVKTQVDCFEIQRRLKAINPAKFPNFEVLVWCAISNMLDVLQSPTFKHSKLRIIDAAKATITILRKWISKKEEHLHAQEIPPHINPNKLINSITYAIGKINKGKVQKLTPFKISTKSSKKLIKRRTPSPKYSNNSDEGETEEETADVDVEEMSPTEGKISIKLNKSLFPGHVKSEPNPEPIKLRLPKLVLKELNPDDNPLNETSPEPKPTKKNITKSGRKRKVPKKLQTSFDHFKSSSDEDTLSKSVFTASNQEKPELVRIRERLQKSQLKNPGTPPATPEYNIAKTVRKQSPKFNEESPDEEVDPSAYYATCKQDSFYVYPTIDSKSGSSRRRKRPLSSDHDDPSEDSSLKLKVRLQKNDECSVIDGTPSTPKTPKSASRPPVKKGYSTPKQRLGKLLKIDKSLYMRR